MVTRPVGRAAGHRMRTARPGDWCLLERGDPDAPPRGERPWARSTFALRRVVAVDPDRAHAPITHVCLASEHPAAATPAREIAPTDRVWILPIRARTDDRLEQAAGETWTTLDQARRVITTRGLWAA